MLPLTRHRFTTAEFERMGETGVLGEDARVELINGEILEMNPIGSRHAGCVDAVAESLMLGVHNAAQVRVQNPVKLGPHDEPQPDVALVRRRPDRYRLGHPMPEDILLLVEVADATLDYDLTVKVPLYARAGVPDLWVVDLIHERLLAHRDPGPNGYRMVQVVRRGEHVAPASFPDLRLAVDEILG